MQGEQIPRRDVTERGVLGDRAYAILDRATGHVASAKHPRKWNNLFRCCAAFAQPPQLDAPFPPVLITLPDGAVVSSADPDVDQILSRVLRRDVALIATAPAAPTREADRSPIDDCLAEIIREEPMALAAPSGTFFDYAPIHVLTTATLARLKELDRQGDFDVRRFRPNIVVAPLGSEPGFVENDWLGHTLKIGSNLLLNIIDPCPRCVVTTLAHGDLPHDPGILRTVAQHNAAASVTLAPGVVFPAVAGVYAGALQGGTVNCGDAIWLNHG
jgi:hypothetical protein